MENNLMKKKICLLIFAAVLGLTACGKGKPEENNQTGTEQVQEYRTDVPVEELKNAVAKELGEDYWPNMALGEEEIEGLLGLKADAIEEAAAEMPMISTNVDTLIIVRADKGKLEEVEKAVADYRERMVGDTMQYPMNVGKVQASKTAVYGDYVCFVQLGGDTMEASGQGDEAVIKQCEAANERALSVIQKRLQTQ